MNTDQYQKMTIIPNDIPDDYKAELKHRARRDVILSLLAPLSAEGNPIFTIQMLEEELPFSRDSHNFCVQLYLTRVQTREIHIARYEDMNLRVLSCSAVDEIKRRIKREVRRLWKWTRHEKVTRRD